MSQENVEVVRQSLRARERSGRTLDQRLFLRFPRLAAVCLHGFAKLPPSSRLRRATMARGTRLAAAAFNRRDMDAVLITCVSEYEFCPAHEFVDGGLMPASYRGPAGYRRFVSDWSDVWGGDLRLDPVEVIDLGSRAVVLWNVPARGQASGVPFIEKWATVSTLKDGKLIRDQVYLSHAEALEAVGLRK